MLSLITTTELRFACKDLCTVTIFQALFQSPTCSQGESSDSFCLCYILLTDDAGFCAAEVSSLESDNSVFKNLLF